MDMNTLTTKRVNIVIPNVYILFASLCVLYLSFVSSLPFLIPFFVCFCVCIIFPIGEQIEMQVIEHNEVPEVEAPELPAPQPGQYSICMLISLKHHFKTSQLEN